MVFPFELKGNCQRIINNFFTSVMNSARLIPFAYLFLWIVKLKDKVHASKLLQEF